MAALRSQLPQEARSAAGPAGDLSFKSSLRAIERKRAAVALRRRATALSRSENAQKSSDEARIIAFRRPSNGSGATESRALRLNEAITLLVSCGIRRGKKGHALSMEDQTTALEKAAPSAPRGGGAAEANLRAAFDGAMDAVIIADRQRRIRSINGSGEEIFGYAEAEARGFDLSFLMPELAPRGLFGAWEQGATARLGEEAKVQGRRKDGSFFPVQLSATLSHCDDHMLFIVFVRDATPSGHGAADSERRYRERIAGMSGVVAALAHEINQPIAAIANYLKVALRLLELRGGRTEAGVAETLHKAANQTLRARDLLRSLQKCVGHGEVEKATVLLHDVIAEVQNKMRFAAEGASVRFTLALNATDDRVLADRIQIEQLFLGLARSATEALKGRAGAELTISTRSGDGQAVIVEVEEKPAKEACSRRKFGASRAAPEDEIDIGRCISHLIVEAHEGQMWTTRSAGGADVFGFSLTLGGSGVK
jgi:PAS domain S-box-containing protein